MPAKNADVPLRCREPSRAWPTPTKLKSKLLGVVPNIQMLALCGAGSR